MLKQYNKTAKTAIATEREIENANNYGSIMDVILLA